MRMSGRVLSRLLSCREADVVVRIVAIEMWRSVSQSSDVLWEVRFTSYCDNFSREPDLS